MYTVSSTNISRRVLMTEKSCFKKLLIRFFHIFSLNGHFSYAFIYGSWEIIRARKVGTTHTKVDYVVYRLFYPIALIAVSLFGVVNERDVGKYFALGEVWVMIVQIIYGFAFLQNVLTNNLHRDNVKHRQKIPERLVVTGEMEKGGHKFYICKRYSILPTEKLYYTERFIYLLFNILASSSCCIMIGQITGLVVILYKQDAEDELRLEKIRSITMALLMVADVILTPIPMYLVHVVFPFVFYGAYQLFLVLIYQIGGLVLYKNSNRYNDSEITISSRIGIKFLIMLVVHSTLTGLAALRDFVISRLDDSKTPKQLQSLRSQRRLARRKLMNYVEDEEGRVIGIELEKHSYEPGLDEYIRTENRKRKRRGRDSKDDADNDSDDEELQALKMFKSRGGGDEATAEDVTGDGGAAVPISDKVKPPPEPRYKVTPEDQFTSSSSSSDELEMVRKTLINLPSPPKSKTRSTIHVPKDKDMERQERSRIPVPLHKLGVSVKPRDSKENIHTRLDTAGDSPPTPPFVKLVQTLIKIQKETKDEIEKELKMSKMGYNYEEGRSINSRMGTAFVQVVRVVRAEDEKKLIKKPEVGFSGKHKPTNVIPIKAMKRKNAARQKRLDEKAKMREEDDIMIDQLIQDSIVQPARPDIFGTQEKSVSKPAPVGKPGAPKPEAPKPVAPKVIFMKDVSHDVKEEAQDSKNQDMSGFHKELTDKLEKEKNKRLGIPEKEDGAKPKKSKGQKRLKKRTKLKGILKRTGEEHELKSKRRLDRLFKRRDEKSGQGKHGKPAYDPLTVPVNVGGPRTEVHTTFHFLGTKLKGDKVDKTTVPKHEVPLYGTHPGIGTVDDGEVVDEDGQAGVQQAKSTITFHPLVRYFDVNEKETASEKLRREKRWSNAVVGVRDRARK